MKYSFIIPAYNEEDYIGDCIKSIKKQKPKSFEIIVVDNGCTDKTVKIARGLGCRVVKESKKGLSNARNKGAKVAKGDIFCFVDADGVLAKNWLEEVERAFNTKDINATTGLICFDHKNVLKKIWYNVYTFFAYLVLLALYVFFERLFLVENNNAITKELFEKLGGFEPVVGEGVWFNYKYWKTKERKNFFNPKMLITYSSRGFEEQGYIRTIAYWIVNALKKTPQESYSYKTKNWDF